MPLVRVKNGLLEEDNFYLTSLASDFLGRCTWSRDENQFILTSGTIKRRFPYNKSFLIDITKESSQNSEYEFFIENNSKRFGLRENSDESDVKYWRLAYYDGFAQSYSSIDGVEWKNNGGCDIGIDGELFQGFTLKKGGSLTIYEYYVYNSPYLKVQNFIEGSYAQLLDSDEKILIERIFDENYECNLMLDSNVTGILKIYKDDSMKDLIFMSPKIDFKKGDIYLFSNKNIQLIYKERILDYTTTNLSENNEILSVKNVGSQEVKGITLEIVNNKNNLIQISIDNENYNKTVFIESLQAEEEKEVYLKIAKDDSLPSFKVNSFDINVY